MLTPSNPFASYGSFGNSVAISGNVLAVGAFEEDAAVAERAGAVYVFVMSAADGFIQTAKLTAPVPTIREKFGVSVAIQNNVLVVGATGDFSGSRVWGSAYVFEKDPSSDAWLLKSKLTSGDHELFDYFGFAVGIANGVVVVGANGGGLLRALPGAVYVFQKRTSDGAWVRIDKLMAVDGKRDEEFGCAVATHGDMVVTGARYERTQGSVHEGAAYIAFI